MIPASIIAKRVCCKIRKLIDRTCRGDHWSPAGVQCTPLHPQDVDIPIILRAVASFCNSPFFINSNPYTFFVQENLDHCIKRKPFHSPTAPSVPPGRHHFPEQTYKILKSIFFRIPASCGFPLHTKHPEWQRTDETSQGSNKQSHTDTQRSYPRSRLPAVYAHPS